MTFGGDAQRQIMGRFATGVALATSTFDDKPYGMTVNSVTSLSLDPPLVLISVNRENNMHKILVSSQVFALNLLTTSQEGVARRFATNGPKDFSDLLTDVAETGAPVLKDSLAYIDCRVIQVVPGGDHDIFIGRCVAGEVHEAEPLIFYAGRFSKLPAAAFAKPAAADQVLLEDIYEYYGSM
jgi:flavin reductase (DIM6/NTAB) family NADH-FMN oxidoreductase RutF